MLKTAIPTYFIIIFSTNILERLIVPNGIIEVSQFVNTIPHTSNAFFQVPLGFLLITCAERLAIRGMEKAVVIQRGLPEMRFNRLSLQDNGMRAKGLVKIKKCSKTNQH